MFDLARLDVRGRFASLFRGRSLSVCIHGRADAGPRNKNRNQHKHEVLYIRSILYRDSMSTGMRMITSSSAIRKTRHEGYALRALYEVLCCAGADRQDWKEGGHADYVSASTQPSHASPSTISTQ